MLSAILRPRLKSTHAATGKSEMNTEETPVGRTRATSEHASMTSPIVVPMRATENDVLVREYSSPHIIQSSAFEAPITAASA